MNEKKSMYKFLLAGGGTGGHLFPAIAVAEQIKELKPEAEILFMGTKNKIEGRLVPQLGYNFKSIWIKGISRKFTLENLLFPVKLIVSAIQSLIINFRFQPAVAIGSGGYVAGPSIWGASIIGAKIILIEQNSYPGLTTRLLEKYADEIHISFEDSKKYLRNLDIVKLTGNPVRKNLGFASKEDATNKFELNTNKKTILVLGGSLGARSINNAVSSIVKKIDEQNLQLIWQTGKIYFKQFNVYRSKNIKVLQFIDDMNLAYAAADLVVARAGATTIAELLYLGKPAVLVPSPNVAENHQYINAKALADKNAVILLEDKNLNSELLSTIMEIITNELKLKDLSRNTLALANPDAAKVIAESAVKFCEEK